MHPRRLSDHFPGFHVPPPTAVVTATTFVVCPMVLLQNFNLAQQLCQFTVYQLAYQQAEAALCASRRRHEWLAVWN